MPILVWKRHLQRRPLKLATSFLERICNACNVKSCNIESISVCLSVTFRCFVQTNEDTIVWFSVSGRTITIVSGEVKLFARDHPQQDALFDSERASTKWLYLRHCREIFWWTCRKMIIANWTVLTDLCSHCLSIIRKLLRTSVNPVEFNGQKEVVESAIFRTMRAFCQVHHQIVPLTRV